MIELAEVVQQLRAEFNRALVSAAHDEVRLVLGPIELEVMVALERSASGQLRFQVIELGENADLPSVSTQRIKLTLRPAEGSESARVSSYWSGVEVAPG